MDKYQLCRTALDAIQYLIGLDFITEDQRSFLKSLFQDVVNDYVEQVLDFDLNKN